MGAHLSVRSAGRSGSAPTRHAPGYADSKRTASSSANRAVLAAEHAESGGLEAFIDVRLTPEKDSEEFLAWANTAPPVHDAVHVTGPYDYLLRVHTRDTHTALDRFLRTLKKEAGAAQTQTRLALNRLESRPGLRMSR